MPELIERPKWRFHDGHFPLIPFTDHSGDYKAGDMSCCCPNICCNREAAGSGKPGAFPTTLNFKILPIDCPCMSAPYTGTLYVSGGYGWQWYNHTIGPLCDYGNYTFIEIQCHNHIKWTGQLRNFGPCTSQTAQQQNLSYIPFDIPLNKGCKPIEGTAHIDLVGLGCCGESYGESHIDIEFWE